MGFHSQQSASRDAGERTLSPSRHNRTWTRWAATRAATPLFARFYEKTGDQAYKEKSFRSFNWTTYMAHDDGLITEATAEDNFWYSDGYGDNIRQFLAGMGSMPEWAPPEENHLLYSSSVVTEVSYGTNELRYSTFDGDATETLRLAFAPARVTAGGIALTKRPDLSQPGWTLDPSTGVARIRRHGAKHVVVSGS